ncbi:hypothetical protein DP939_00860 [Spongiactinospora rosea]|uniref:Uncharacterized protein n=1 Tax=Spongiactinospora rosea TaxID=2248750 RepID=A0A366M5I6_9ACTN|nr:hypothetical protein [Spongiactinospora rosea]RBQ21307.1 hypothetical protein DP939_00860 [Spongiactinospora rosea]
MRIARFRGLLVEWLSTAGGDVIKDVTVFGVPSLPEAGVRVGLGTGAGVLLRTIGGAPRGGNKGSEAAETERGPVLEPVPLPAVPVTGGKVRTADVLAYVAAVIVNAGSDEIERVEAKDQSVVVTFFNGGQAYMMTYKTVPAGRDAESETEWKAAEVV